MALFGVFFVWGFSIGINSAQAGLIIDDNLLYFNSGLTTTADESTSNYIGSLAVGATIQPMWTVGWNITYNGRTSGSASGTTSLKGYEMGPRIGVLLGKSQWFNIAFTWNALANATYVGANGNESVSGSGFGFEVGCTPQVTEHLYAGVKLLYDHVGYGKSTDSSNTTSTVSYSTNDFLPVLALSWRW